MSKEWTQKGHFDINIALDTKENADALTEKLEEFKKNLGISHWKDKNGNPRQETMFTTENLEIGKYVLDSEGYPHFDLSFDLVNDNVLFTPGSAPSWNDPGSPDDFENLLEDTDITENVEETIRLFVSEDCGLDVEIEDYTLTEEQDIYEEMADAEEAAYEAYQDRLCDEYRDRRLELEQDDIERS